MSEYILAFLCVLIVVESLYLTLSRVFHTGVMGSVGLGFAAVGAVSILFGVVLEGTSFELVPETMLLLIGLVIFLSQHMYRVVVNSKKETR